MNGIRNITKRESDQFRVQGFHAEYTTKKEILEGIADLAEKYKAPVYTHNFRK